jgi:hypothetical protein
MKANSVGKSFVLAEIPSFCQVLLFEKRITVVVKWMDGWMDGWSVDRKTNFHCIPLP